MVPARYAIHGYEFSSRRRRTILSALETIVFLRGGYAATPHSVLTPSYAKVQRLDPEVIHPKTLVAFRGKPERFSRSLRVTSPSMANKMANHRLLAEHVSGMEDYA
jgi:hypothetical protein